MHGLRLVSICEDYWQRCQQTLTYIKALPRLKYVVFQPEQSI